MKRFGFSLDEGLHEALRAQAEEEGVSMAVLCREALQIHLQRPAIDCAVADTSPQSPASNGLQEASQYLWEDSEEQDPFRELDDFLADTFRPEHTPDLFFQEEDDLDQEPSQGWITEAAVTEPIVSSYLSSELAIYERSAPSFRRGRTWQSYSSRLLDELWA